MLRSSLKPAPWSCRRPCRAAFSNNIGRQLTLQRCTRLRPAAAHVRSCASSTASSKEGSSLSSRTTGGLRLLGHRQSQHSHQAASIAREVDFERQRKATSRLPEVNELNSKYGFKSLVEFYEAENGLPACYLMHPRGHILEIYLQGATITRWIDEMGKNMLFMRPDAIFEQGRAINSGIPLFFPQWREGLLPEMGFADKAKWEVVATDLDFEFQNQVGFPDFAGGEATMLVDENFDSPFTLEVEPDNYEADLEDALEDAEATASAGRVQGGDAPKPAALKRGRKKKVDADPDAAISPAAALGELPKPAKPRRGRPPAKDNSPGPAGGPVVSAAAASPSADVGVGEGEVGEDEAAAEGLGEGEQQQGVSAEEEAELAAFEEWMENVDWGVIGDLAPCVTLRLTDTPETRAMWPHKFELLYKITLMEEDDFPNPTAGLPDGVFEYTGSTANVPSYVPTTPADLETLPGPPVVNDISTGEVKEVPMQIKMEWHLTNKGEAEEAPMEFQLGARTLFATKDQASYRNMVQVLGLGGKMMLDYGANPRTPQLNLCQEDYVDFDGARHDAVYINTQDATVKFCPGGRSHFELLQRQGLNDTIAYHPGGLPPPGLEDASRFMAGLGVGRIAVPKRLAPGDSWQGEYVIRHHKRYWDPPLWARRQPQPMPGLVLEDDEADGEDAVDPELLQEMERQQVGGLVADGPQ